MPASREPVKSEGKIQNTAEYAILFVETFPNVCVCDYSDHFFLVVCTRNLVMSTLRKGGCRKREEDFLF